jgi:hypothetical protein
MDDPFIQIFSNSLSSMFCKEIIECHKNEKNKYPGHVASGVNKKIKDTTDYSIPTDINIHSMWYAINKTLEKELYEKLNLYVDNINKSIFKSNSNIILKSNMILTDDGFLVQKYDKNIGKYIYHNDSRHNYDMHRSRVLTYLWYLNDVTEGGETEFLGGKYKIKPETGKLILFPASWIYPHRGCCPISDDKYIVTGWLYEEDLDFLINKPNKKYKHLLRDISITNNYTNASILNT